LAVFVDSSGITCTGTDFDGYSYMFSGYVTEDINILLEMQIFEP
jgi:hypothetical protein